MNCKYLRSSVVFWCLDLPKLNCWALLLCIKAWLSLACTGPGPLFLGQHNIMPSGVVTSVRAARMHDNYRRDSKGPSMASTKSTCWHPLPPLTFSTALWSIFFHLSMALYLRQQVWNCSESVVAISLGIASQSINVALFLSFGYKS